MEIYFVNLHKVLKLALFWEVTRCSLLRIGRRLCSSFCFLTVKMEAIRPTETLVSLSQAKKESYPPGTGIYIMEGGVLGNSFSYTRKRRQGKACRRLRHHFHLTHSHTRDALYFTYIALVTFRFESSSNAFLNQNNGHPNSKFFHLESHNIHKKTAIM